MNMNYSYLSASPNQDSDAFTSNVDPCDDVRVDIDDED